MAGSYLSIKRGYPAEALGIRTGSDARRGVMNGMHGAGLAAPWNMIVQMWGAEALANRPGVQGRRGRVWLAFLASMFLAGSVSEPVSQKIVSRELPTPDTLVAVANIAIPIVMLAAALASLLNPDGENRGNNNKAN